jgi:hypothetical protein
MPAFNINTGLPDLPSGLDDEKASLVAPLYRAVSVLAQQLSYLTGVIQYDASEQAIIDQFTGLSNSRGRRIYVRALETIPYGALVTLSIDGSRLAASLADAATLTKPAHAICDMPLGIASGSDGACIFGSGMCKGVSGTTLGTTYYLSAAGAMQSTVPAADASIKQIVATGLGSAGVMLNIQPVGKMVSSIYKPNSTTLRVLYTDGSYTDWSV